MLKYVTLYGRYSGKILISVSVLLCVLCLYNSSLLLVLFHVFSWLLVFVFLLFLVFFLSTTEEVLGKSLYIYIYIHTY